jgi:Spy/CpxP family protein refolding chaperone
MSRIVLACTLVAALSFVGTPGFGKDARLPHDGAWPIYDWHDHQPTQDQLNALHLRDITPNQAQEVDRLYNQLESSSSRILKQEPALVH